MVSEWHAVLFLKSLIWGAWKYSSPTQKYECRCFSLSFSRPLALPSYWIASRLGICESSGVAGGVLASTLMLVALHGAPRVALPLPLAVPASTWVPLLLLFPKTTRMSTHSQSVLTPQRPKLTSVFKMIGFPIIRTKSKTFGNTKWRIQILETDGLSSQWGRENPFYSGWSGASKDLPLQITFQLRVQDDELSQIISTT